MGWKKELECDVEASYPLTSACDLAEVLIQDYPNDVKKAVGEQLNLIREFNKKLAQIIEEQITAKEAAIAQASSKTAEAVERQIGTVTTDATAALLRCANKARVA